MNAQEQLKRARLEIFTNQFKEVVSDLTIKYPELEFNIGSVTNGNIEIVGHIQNCEYFIRKDVFGRDITYGF